jgi:hypothetical protein
MSHITNLPMRAAFFCDHLTPFRILPDAPDFANIGICVVCQKYFNDASYDTVAISSCEHTLHRKCMIGWAESTNPQRDNCPSCREVVYWRENLMVDEIRVERKKRRKTRRRE